MQAELNLLNEPLELRVPETIATNFNVEYDSNHDVQL